MIERGIITVKELKEKIYKIEGVKVSIEVPDFMHCKDYNFEPLYTSSMYFGDDWDSRKAQWGKGQYFDHDGKYYDWDDDTYLQGSISMEDII